MKPYSEEKGIQYLTALVRAQFDPDAAEPPLPGTKTNQKSNKPRTIPELRQKMAQRLAEKIRKEFQPDGIGSLFVLTQRQTATLEALELPPELTEEVLSLNWLREEISNYAVNDRLEIIATMPPSDEGKKPDWNKWWMDHAGSNIGVHRPQDHDPLKDPLSEMLNQVISAMAQAATPEIPNHGKMARLHAGIWSPGGLQQQTHQAKERETGPHPGLDHGRKNKQPGMGDRNNRAGTSQPEGRTAQRYCWQELKEQGTQGAPGHGDNHRAGGTQENAAGSQTSNIRTPTPGADSGTTGMPRKTTCSTTVGTARTAETRSASWKEKSQKEIRTQAEWDLMILTVPEHPGAKDAPLNRIFGINPDEEASNIGFLNQLSPKAVREYLRNSEEPNPPMPEPCPRAAECPSWCGRLQETREFPSH